MSKVCYLVIRTDTNCSLIREVVTNAFLSLELGVDYNVEYEEPALSRYSHDYLICSITDGPNNSNCEEFLLADGCYYSGGKNNIPFLIRMRNLAWVVGKIESISSKVELFLGDSGTEYDDYREIIISAADFPVVANNLFNNVGFPQLHFIFGGNRNMVRIGAGSP